MNGSQHAASAQMTYQARRSQKGMRLYARPRIYHLPIFDGYVSARSLWDQASTVFAYIVVLVETCQVYFNVRSDGAHDSDRRVVMLNDPSATQELNGTMSPAQQIQVEPSGMQNINIMPRHLLQKVIVRISRIQSSGAASRAHRDIKPPMDSSGRTRTTLLQPRPSALIFRLLPSDISSTRRFIDRVQYGEFSSNSNHAAVHPATATGLSWAASHPPRGSHEQCWMTRRRSCSSKLAYYTDTSTRTSARRGGSARATSGASNFKVQISQSSWCFLPAVLSFCINAAILPSPSFTIVVSRPRVVATDA